MLITTFLSFNDIHSYLTLIKKKKKKRFVLPLATL